MPKATAAKGKGRGSSETKRGPAPERQRYLKLGLPADLERVADPANLKALRYHLHLKQRHLAALLGVNVMTVSRWERGGLTPTPYQLVMLNAFAIAARADFTWSSHDHGYGYALEFQFEHKRIPRRLWEILAAAVEAAKGEGE